MGATTVSGPIRTGRDPGYSDGNTIGRVMLNQTADVSAAETSAATKFVLPANSSVVEFVIDVTTVFEASAAAVMEFGVSGDPNYFGQISVSAAGRYTHVPAASAGADWVAVDTNDFRVTAMVSAAGTAPDTGNSIVRIVYEQTA